MGALNLKQIGRPVSLAITSPAVTITDISSGHGSDDFEMLKHRSGNKRTARRLKGDDLGWIEVTTTDASAITSLKKGTLCTTIVLTRECTKAANTATTTPTELLKTTITVGSQENDLAPEPSSDGSPKSYTLRFETCEHPETGVEGTCAVTFAAP